MQSFIHRLPVWLVSLALWGLLGLLGLLGAAPGARAAVLAEYRMDEAAWTGAAGEVLDSSGNGRHGSRLGAASVESPGHRCRAMRVPLNSTTASDGLATGLDVDTAMGASGGVAMWFQMSNSWNSSGSHMLADASAGSLSTSPTFFFMRGSGGFVRFSLTDSAGTRTVLDSPDQSFSAKTWVHVGITWRLSATAGESQMRIFVNNVQVASRSFTSSGALHASLGSLIVGDSRPGVTPFGGTATSADATIDEVWAYAGDTTALDIGRAYDTDHGCESGGLHSLRLSHASGTGVTCAPSTVTITACQDAACTTGYTSGVSGSVGATGAGVTTQFPEGSTFAIPAGSSSTTLRLQITTPGSVLLGATPTSTTASAATTCSFGSPSCTFTAAAAGLLFDVPDHVSETAQTVGVSAVRSSDNAKVCVPAFASVTRAVNLRCAHSNPAAGSVPVRVNGTALNASGSATSACDAGGRTLNLAFDATGTASMSVQYADVGLLALSATYSGTGSDAGLVMTGTDSFVAAPASFAFAGLPALAQAGVPFSPTLSARNASGAVTPNFGREAPAQAPVMALTHRQPAANGTLGTPVLGAFNAGTATWSGVSWSEVGTLDLGATLSSYLGAAASASGTATVRFVPFRFAVSLANRAAACTTAGYAYSGEPFTVTVTAQNAASATTLNYEGAFARATTLALVPALGSDSFSAGSGPAASLFSAGMAQLTAPVYTFAGTLTSPRSITVRATDADGVASVASTEGALSIRSGRLRLSNAYGSERSPLVMPLVAEIWSGQAWVLHAADNACTVLTGASVARSNARTHTGAAGSMSPTPTLAAAGGGRYTLTLSAPNVAGTVDIALNLGSTAADQACLGTHPTSTGAAVPWLRSRNGSCGAWDRDPSARAAFGIYSPESQRTVHVRDLF